MRAPSTPPEEEPFPASALLHPVSLGALVLWVLNDHVFKARWPSGWTGKLSDVAGLVFFPLLLQAGWEVLAARGGRAVRPSRRVLLASVLFTAVGFSAIQVWPWAAEAWRWGLGALQWPVRALVAGVRGGPLPSLRPVFHVADAEDLLALPALGLALWTGWRRSRAPVDAGLTSTF
ncbi:hypothetical protein [Melittangium boletus]|uniref:Uncharacterized protein n=1 Tax=Melittangium boletus DSM 14713 TaxID=1294270 RepID=A0A250IBI7_9BACT|nr:hypothetical protein [Melittangium boletus]ATB28511.1 hypothetical protein MEBOL_001959 [Melittangium boletus DSM 14713]